MRTQPAKLAPDNPTMSTITRQTFVDTLTTQSHLSLAVNQLDPALSSALQAAGVSSHELSQLAGTDGRVANRREYHRLFSLLDRRDHNGSRHSIDRDGESGAGLACEQLMLQAAAQRSARDGHGILFVGLREASLHEATALSQANRQAQTVAITAQTREQPFIDYRGRRFEIGIPPRLSTVHEIFRSLGLSERATAAFIQLLQRSNPTNQSLLLQLGMALFRTGNGDLALDRLVLSGHGDGKAVMGDDTSRLAFQDLAELAHIFAAGAARIKHVAVAACYSGFHEHVDTFRQAFPGLQSFTGYHGPAPLAETSSPAQLARWEGRTDGDPAHRVDPSGETMASWNSHDGYQGVETRPLEAARQHADTMRRASLDLIILGERTVDEVRPALDAYYERLVELIYHPDLPPAERASLEVDQRQALRLRHPELTEAF